jgi:hypothetical protein
MKAEFKGGEGGGALDTSADIPPGATDIINKIIDKIAKGVVDRIHGHKAVESLAQCVGSKCAAIIDTGSNIIAAPSKAIKQFAEASKVKPDCSNLDSLPNITVKMGDSTLTLDAQAYVMQVKLPSPKKHEIVHASMLEHSSSQNLWQDAFRDLHERTGVDLSVALHEGVDLKGLAKESKLCMPALVPLDKETEVGSLWVFGTPLFERYYTRWSYPAKAAHPSIFFKQRNEASTCKATASKHHAAFAESSLSAADAHFAADVHSQRESTGSTLLRREPVAEHPATPWSSSYLSPRDEERPFGGLSQLSSTDARSRIREVDLFEIKFPHWAKHLSDL